MIRHDIESFYLLNRVGLDNCMECGLLIQHVGVLDDMFLIERRTDALKL